MVKCLLEHIEQIAAKHEVNVSHARCLQSHPDLATTGPNKIAANPNLEFFRKGIVAISADQIKPSAQKAKKHEPANKTKIAEFVIKYNIKSDIESMSINLRSGIKILCNI